MQKLTTKLLTSCFAGIAKAAAPASENAMFFVRLKKSDGAWHFTDKARGLIKEPLVAGIPEILEELIDEEGIRMSDARRGISLTFAGRKFPGWQVKLTRKKKEAGGAWYETEEGDRGWLCPALLKFFKSHPANIWAAVSL